VSHASQKVLDLGFRIFGDLTGRKLAKLANEAVADGEEAEMQEINGC